MKKINTDILVRISTVALLFALIMIPGIPPSMLVLIGLLGMAVALLLPRHSKVPEGKVIEPQ